MTVDSTIFCFVTPCSTVVAPTIYIMSVSSFDLDVLLPTSGGRSVDIVMEFFFYYCLRDQPHTRQLLKLLVICDVGTVLQSCTCSSYLE
jgi:hypothetical protein